MIPVSMMQQSSGQSGIVQSNLITWYDATNPECYPGYGSEMYDLSGNNIHGSWNTEPYLDGKLFHIDPGTEFSAGWKNLRLQNFTVSFWWAHNSNLFFQVPLQLFRSGDDNLTFSVNNPNSGPLYRRMWVYWNSSGSNLAALSMPYPGDSDLVNGAIRQYTFRRDITDEIKCRHYINGVEVTTGRQTGGSQNDAIIGYEGAKLVLGGETFQGRIGEVLIYDRALSDAEIQQNYQTSEGKFY